jgi:hypothetical protein
VVTESSTGPIKRFKEMNVAHVGVHGWVSPAVDSYHLSAHLRAIPEEGGVGIWEVVFQKNPVIKRGHQL